LSAAGHSLGPLRQIAGRLALAGLAMFLLDAVAFRFAYPPIVEPDSTTGSVEMRVWNEQKRERSGYVEILALGDSRMPLLPRSANETSPESGYYFASIATAGTSPRCWYYMLRDVDPGANHYRAILIPEYRYEDRGSYERYDDRIRDLNYSVGRLRMGDAFQFAASMYSLKRKLQALRGALWKGFVYQTDFREFLKDPAGRVEKAEWYRREQWGWLYNYEGGDGDLVGLRANWEENRLEYGEGFPGAPREGLENELLGPPAPPDGRFRAYRRKWYGKILERYEGSETQFVFLRMARGPVVRPDSTDDEETSIIRDLASRPGVLVLEEHTFDYLEDPAYFQDALHMNGRGSRLFSERLVAEIVELLGPGS
jgi:hypothetical protein